MAWFGLHLNSFAYPGVPTDELFARAVAIATAAEESGFDSIWVLDHFVQGGHAGLPHEPMPEAYAMLSALAARTRTVQVGTLVTAVTFRNPAHLAKLVTTLDVISAGRAILGIGAAWHEPEHTGYGIPFPSVKERMDRLEETLQICKLMFTEERPSFEGQHYRIREAINVPRPVQAGGPPVLIGGTGEKRTLRLVARYADISNFPKHTRPEVIPHKLDLLRRYCDEGGRSYDDIVKTRKRTLVIAPGRLAVRRKGNQQRRAWNEPRKRYRGMVTEGTPKQIVEHVERDLEAGFDGVIFNITDDYDIDMVRLAGETLRSHFPERRAIGQRVRPSP